MRQGSNLARYTARLCVSLALALDLEPCITLILAFGGGGIPHATILCLISSVPESLDFASDMNVSAVFKAENSE